MTVVFIGTFDPFHGAHIGQLFRAYNYLNFSKVYVLVDKNPPHKPNASMWQYRVEMVGLSLDELNMPFSYEIIPVRSSLANEITQHIDYKVCGIDSLIDNLQDPERISYAFKWPMIVLSIPGIPKSQLTKIIDRLPEHKRHSVHYEYVNDQNLN